jgi:hypothetical protein
MQNYLVRGYSRTGIYAEVVPAESERAALTVAKPRLIEMAFGRITKYTVEVDNG